MELLGSAVELGRFPVKSMQGESLETAYTTERGFIGDRVYALIDVETGKVVSAKNPRKWPGLLELSATFVTTPGAEGPLPPVRILFRGGESLSSEDPRLNARLSGLFGREVEFRSTPPPAPVLEEYWPDMEGLAHRETVTDESMSLGAPPGTFFDFAAIHLVTTSTLSTLAQAYPEGRFALNRFRPNLVIESGQDGFPENEWVGRRIGVGPEVILEVTMPCPRCVMTTLGQGDLPPDPGILRTAARKNNIMVAPLNQRMPSVGVYAKVLRGGPVHRGDEVRPV